MYDDRDILIERLPASVWQALRGRRLFLTGGTGWLGRNLLAAIAWANAEWGAGIQVTALTRSPARFAREAPELCAAGHLTLLAGDVRDFTFPRGRHELILHAAAPAAEETFAGAAPLAKFETLTLGTRRVLEFARHCEAERVLFTSSGVAGGGNPNATWREDDPTNLPTSDTATALGQGKRAAEFLCACHAEQFGWHSTIARLFSFVGPHMPLDLHYAIGNFLRDALTGQPIVVHGDGSPVRSFMYTGDLAVWLLHLLARPGPTRLYNVGSDEAISIAALAERIRDRFAPAAELRILGQSTLSIGNPVRSSYVPDIRRAREELGLATWTPLDEALRRTAAGLPLPR